jgi:hypothetical protein
MPAPWHSSRAPAFACAAVHEDRLIRKVNGHFHGLQPVGSNIHQAAQIFKEADRDSPVDGVVFGQQYVARAAGRRSGIDFGGATFLDARQGQRKHEFRSDGRFARSACLP